ncbi:MAG TPA: hypothetical protein VLQ67_14810 [Arachnia sp.]|nr:hypothetical protein [Arachnia sp.]
MGLLRIAREVKHLGLVSVKKARPTLVRLCDGALDVYTALRLRGHSYEFRPERYRRSFLVRRLLSEPIAGEMPGQVFCFWTGSNPLTENRERNLRGMEKKIGLPVILVTPQNLGEWVKADWPLHPAYEFLSLVHRSDYLRAYFLHHYGGGYCDIKAPTPRWDRVWQSVSHRQDVWYVARGHESSGHVASLPGALGLDVRMWHRIIPSNLACLARSHTPLTLEWLTEVERRLDYFYPQLKEFPGGERGAVVGYPISWNRLLNQVHHPLALKYNEWVVIDDRIDVARADYL